MADDAVEQRKQQNPDHVDVTGLVFMDYDNFEWTTPEAFGPGDKYLNADFLGPQPLVREEFVPVAPRELQLALSNTERLRRYFEEHRVRDRWIYAFVVNEAGTARLGFEIHVDKRGFVRYIDAEAFATLREDAAADTELEARYLERSAWKRVPLPGIPDLALLFRGETFGRWHFFGSALRFSASGIDNLIAAKGLFVPDPGFALLGRIAASTPAELERTQALAMGSATIARVFDPVVLVLNMVNELHTALDTYVRFAVPGKDKPAVAASTQKRLALVLLAERLERIRQAKFDEDNDEVLESTDAFMRRVANDCYTPAERRIAQKFRSFMAARRPSEFVLLIERELLAHYTDRINRTTTKLLLWLASPAWAEVEREYFADEVRSAEKMVEFARVATRAYERLSETHGGRRHMARMLETLVTFPRSTQTANQQFLEAFAFQDREPEKTAFDHGAHAHQVAGFLGNAMMAFHGLETAMTARHLKAAALAPLSKDAEKILNKLPARERVFSAGAFRLQRRLKNIFRINAFDIGVETAPKTVMLMASRDASGKTVTRTVRLTFTLGTEDEFARSIAEARRALKLPREKPTTLTFDQLRSRIGVIGVGVSARAWMNAWAKEDDTLRNKSALSVLRGLYELPPVQKELLRRLETGSLFAVASRARVWAQRSIPFVGFALGAAATYYTLDEFWRKAGERNNEQLWVHSLNLSAEIVLTAGAGAVVLGSLGVITLTTAACVAAVATAVGLGLAAAAYISDKMLPEDVRHAFATSIFGVEFSAKTTAPNNDGRPWQACRGNNLQLFNAGAGGAAQLGLAGLRTQLRAFENLAHNFRAQVRLREDGVLNIGGVIRLLLGQIPRAAYFELVLKLTWKLTLASDETVQGVFGLRLYPFPDNITPTPQKNVPPFLAALRKDGFDRLVGGPLALRLRKSDAGLDIIAEPAPGHVTSWVGTIESNINGKATATVFQLKRSVDYELKVEVSEGPNQRFVATFTLEMLPETDPSVTFDAVDIELLFAQDGTLNVPKRKRQRNPSGARRMVVPFVLEFEDEDGTTFDGNVERFRVTPSYRDLGSPASPVPKGSTRDRPGRFSEGLRDFTTDERFHYKVNYVAKINHDGRRARIVFDAIDAVLRKEKNGPVVRVVKRPLVEDLLFVFIRNEGAAPPLAEGSRTFEDGNRGPLSHPFGGPPAAHHEAELVDRIHLFDKLAVRFTMRVPAKPTPVFAHGELQEIEVQWSYSFQSGADNDVRIEDAAVLTRVACDVRLVLDGDDPAATEASSKLLSSSVIPNHAVPGAPQPFVELVHNRSIQANSDEVSAANSCKT